MADRVKLRHPQTGGEWDCPTAAVDGWLANGWQKADDKGALKPETDPAPKGK